MYGHGLSHSSNAFGLRHSAHKRICNHDNHSLDKRGQAAPAEGKEGGGGGGGLVAFAAWVQDWLVQDRPGKGLTAHL